MTPTITEFYAAAKTDASLRAQLQTARSAQEVVGMAARRGFNFTIADLESSSRALGEVQLSEGELAGVTGGMTGCHRSDLTWGDPNRNETLINA